MNYTEKYEVRQHEGFRYTTLHQFDNETDAIAYMDLMARSSDCWHVVRVMEVTVASVIKA